MAPSLVPAFLGGAPCITPRHHQRRVIGSAVCRKPRMTLAEPDKEADKKPGADWDLKLGSPSKINLFLRVMGKRSDGFHELASLFQTISLHDTMYFSAKSPDRGDAPVDTLECDTPGIPTDSSNLVIKALNTFRDRTGIDKYFRVRLEKRIPHEAGLGGGSSNAATALWAANVLCDRPCSLKELAEFGAEFGSDVSFFLSNGTAYCTGRGEILEEIPRMRPLTLYLVKPPEGLSTADVFRNLDVSKCSTRNPRELLDKMREGIMWADFVNDLEEPSFKLLPRLSVLKEKLYEAGFNKVMMSGSGTAFFCLGHPHSQDDFLNVFPVENNVKVFPAMFHGRRFEDLWYFEQPPLKPKNDPWEKFDELMGE